MKKSELSYDVGMLKTVAECRTVMKRAKEHGKDHVYVAVFRRQCALVSYQNDDHADPLIRDFQETLAAYEQLLSEKNGRNQAARRTRQKIADKGVHQSLIEWTRGKLETNGLKLLGGGRAARIHRRISCHAIRRRISGGRRCARTRAITTSRHRSTWGHHTICTKSHAKLGL